MCTSSTTEHHTLIRCLSHVTGAATSGSAAAATCCPRRNGKRTCQRLRTFSLLVSSRAVFVCLFIPAAGWAVLLLRSGLCTTLLHLIHRCDATINQIPPCSALSLHPLTIRFPWCLYMCMRVCVCVCAGRSLVRAASQSSAVLSRTLSNTRMGSALALTNMMLMGRQGSRSGAQAGMNGDMRSVGSSRRVLMSSRSGSGSEIGEQAGGSSSSVSGAAAAAAAGAGASRLAGARQRLAAGGAASAAGSDYGDDDGGGGDRASVVGPYSSQLSLPDQGPSDVGSGIIDSGAANTGANSDGGSGAKGASVDDNAAAAAVAAAIQTASPQGANAPRQLQQAQQDGSVPAVVPVPVVPAVRGERASFMSLLNFGGGAGLPAAAAASGGGGGTDQQQPKQPHQFKSNQVVPTDLIPSLAQPSQQQQQPRPQLRDNEDNQGQTLKPTWSPGTNYSTPPIPSLRINIKRDGAQQNQRGGPNNSAAAAASGGRSSAVSSVDSGFAAAAAEAAVGLNDSGGSGASPRGGGGRDGSGIPRTQSTSSADWDFDIEDDA